MIDTRKEISEILVKWNMPIRQVAINELIELCKRLEEQSYGIGYDEGMQNGQQGKF